MRRLKSHGLAAISLASAAFISQPPTSASRPQPSTIAITVVDSLARFPLVNADVIDLATGQHRFTDENGVARLTWPNAGVLRLRVREVGYRPSERTLEQSTAGAQATFAMAKVAYVLSTVRASSRCTTTADSTALDMSLAALEQLKQAAEKFDEFRDKYPFEVTLERRSARVPEREGEQPRITASLERTRSDKWGVDYKPGKVVEYERGGFSVPILFLSNLGDSVFWAHHCFVATGFQSYQGAPVVRIEFTPSADTRDADFEGAAYLDSATSSLRRVDFRVTNLDPRREPKRMEGYSTFVSPSPFIVVPDTSIAVWWYRTDPNGGWGKPDYVQRVHLQQLKYRYQKPPASADDHK